MSRYLAAIAVLAVVSAPVSAGNSVSGAPTLQRFTSARAAGMGEAFSAVPGDLLAWQYNPAMLGWLPSPQVAASVSRGFAADYMSALSAGYPTRLGVFAVSLNYYDTGAEELLASDGTVFDVHLQRDMLGAVSYARKIGGLAVGANAKYLNSELAEYRSGGSVALDAGAAFTFESPAVTLGAALRNVGRGIKFISSRDPLPKEFRAGFSYAHAFDGNSKMLFSVDVPYLIPEGKTTCNAGVEWLPHKGLSIRIGQHLKSDIISTSFGFGISSKVLSLDYAFGSTDAMDDLHNVGISYRWE